MQKTANYNLNKPEGSDVVDISKLNDNADVIDAELKKRALTTQLPTKTSQLTNDSNLETTTGSQSKATAAQTAAQSYTDSKISSLVNSAPAALDTLKELADALGDDPNFRTTILNAIATKLNTSAYTAADILAKLKTVDGSGSGLDADTATKLATARTIALTGDATGSTSFDGSSNVSITVTVADDSHNHVIGNVDGLQTALDGKQAALAAENRRKITFGTTDPTGGTDGDIYLQYE